METCSENALKISQNPSAIIAIQQPSALVGADAAVALASPARPWPLQESIPRFSTLSSIAANLSQYIDYKWMIYGGYIRDVLMNARPQLTQRCQFHSSWRHRICLVDPFDSRIECCGADSYISPRFSGGC